ncbi:uncharacterized protein [Maniola hyperantus]|uniref:uncharacterized protein n=1 Tax=Aphantopus hyperantus TaxID=2795564 RepID=UPI002134BB18
MILILYTVCLITGAMCYEVHQNDEYGTTLNVTTLYPVLDFVQANKHNNSDNSKAKSNKEDKIVSTSGEEPNDQLGQNDLAKESSKEFDKSLRNDKNDANNTNNKLDNLDNETDLNKNQHEQEKLKIPKLDTNNWKIDTFFTPSNISKPENNKNDSENKIIQAAGKEFKPSPQLGHFYSEDAFVVPTQPTTGSFSPVNKNPPTFFSSPGDFYKLNYKPLSYSAPIDTPYKFEKSVSSKDEEWKYSTGVEAKPTAKGPVKIPAGGLYKLPDPFKEKPSSSGDPFKEKPSSDGDPFKEKPSSSGDPFKEKPSSDGDDDNFGLDFKDDEKGGKENSVKKRGNPWKSLLHLVTALIPVGIILSALTPNLITLDTVDNNHHYPNRFSRRSGDAAALPAISETCKRKLLCELHADSNYNIQSRRRPKHCYKIQCHDPQALSKVLHWLLLYNRSRASHPDEHHRRGYIT